MRHISVFASLAKVFQIPLRPSVPTQFLLPSTSKPTSIASSIQQTSNFSSTTSLEKKQKGGRRVKERRITAIRWSLYHPTQHLPRPLRFSRMRGLRHWTIHRAWQLYQRQLRTQHNLQLERQWESMRMACEQLRLGVGDGGKLFRKAISKKGVWGGRSDLGTGGVRPGYESGDSGRVEKGREGGVPIEYTRGLVDAPGREGGFDESWTRA